MRRYYIYTDGLVKQLVDAAGADTTAEESVERLRALGYLGEN